MNRFMLLPVLAAVILLGSPAVAREWGDLKLRFVYGGEPPKPAKIRSGKDVEFCGQHDLIDERLLVHPDNRGINNLIVYLYTSRGGTPLPAIHPALKDKKRTRELSVRNCRFEPRVLVMQKGDDLLLNYPDPIGHNFNFNFFRNSPYGITIPLQRNKQRLQIKEAEPAPIPVECNIHPWEKAYILVADHPYAAASGEDGVTVIRELPAGVTLTFRIFHESFHRAGPIEGLKIGGGKVNARNCVELQIAPGGNDLGEVVIPASAFFSESAHDR